MTATATFSNKRALQELLGGSRLMIADVTFDIGSGEASLALTVAQIKAGIGLRRIDLVIPQSSIGNSATGPVGVGVAPELDVNGLPTFRFWEAGAANAPLIPNNSNYTGGDAITIRYGFLGN